MIEKAECFYAAGWNAVSHRMFGVTFGSKAGKKRYATHGIMSEELRRVAWIASSHKDLKSFPDEVKDDVGIALYRAQEGKKHIASKPLQGFGGAGVLEVIADHDGNTYRAVYTVRFADIVYVLHCFQKKSKSGIATPKYEIDLIKARLKLAEEEYKRWKGKK